jgi:hypothetical protein
LSVSRWDGLECDVAAVWGEPDDVAKHTSFVSANVNAVRFTREGCRQEEAELMIVAQSSSLGSCG